MKPILVKNQSEWNRLAPVLEALGVTMPQGFNYSEHVPQLPTVIRLRPNTMSWCATDVNDWARPQGETLQTVDEYLQAQEPKDISFLAVSVASKNAKQQLFGVATPYIEPDYKALYEELLAKHEKPCDPERLCCHNATQKLKGQLGESEAKYEALVESVKDAIVEIRDNSNMAASLMLSKSDKSYGYISEGMDDAISILKRKTGVYPL